MVQATGPFWRNHIYIDTMLPKTLQHRTIGRCIHVGAGQHTYLDASFSGELAKGLRQSLAAEVEHGHVHTGARLLQFGENQRDSPSPGRKGHAAGDVPVNGG